MNLEYMSWIKLESKMSHNTFFFFDSTLYMYLSVVHLYPVIIW